MNETPKAFIEYVNEKYGELTFFPALAMLSVQSSIEVETDGKEQRYFIPEAMINLEEPEESIGLIFGAGGYGRMIAICDKLFLNFTLTNDDGEVVSHGRTKLPDVSQKTRDKALKDKEFHGSMFSVTGRMPNFSMVQSGYLSMSIEFAFEDDDLIQLVSGGKSEETVASFENELCKVRVQIGPMEE